MDEIQSDVVNPPCKIHMLYKLNTVGYSASTSAKRDSDIVETTNERVNILQRSATKEKKKKNLSE